MKQVIAVVLIAGVLFAAGCHEKRTGVSADMRAEYLRCEYRVDPLGIDVAKPRLSWVLDSAQRGQRQTAYQVLAASSRTKLDQHVGDLWDTGKVDSDETTAIVYEGQPLVSGGDCFWKVRVWDKDGKVSGWSPAAHWSAGLLNDSDWKAQWIGLDVPTETSVAEEGIAQAKWIWSQAANADGNQDVCERTFVRRLEIPEGVSVKSAVAYLAADDYFRMSVNDTQVASANNFNSLKEVHFTDQLQRGLNFISVMAGNRGTSPNPAGLVGVFVIETENDRQIFVTDSEWMWQAAPSDLRPAVVVSSYGTAPWGKIALSENYLPPARYLRKEFAAKGGVRSARLYATSLGINQLFLNGQRVTDDYFSPGWTDYAKRIHYRTWDVTNLMKAGGNAVGAILADGWYAGYVGYGHKREHYGRNLRLKAQLQIEYTDGSTDVIATGPDWKASTGPILEADFLMGEVYDARLEQDGWNASGFNDSAWQSVAVGGNEIDPLIQAAVSEPVRVFEKVRPVSISEPKPGVYVFDMGQNFAGVVKLTAKEGAGQKIQLRFAERLNPDGTIYTTNLRAARATDTYICKGDGVETWQPYFTFHGFQYVELTGVSKKPTLDAVEGLAMSSDTPMAGRFQCSDPMVNKIYSNSKWTQLMNFIDVPTDCPQRDERLGWTGDAQVYINTACYITDVHAFFTKWLTDLSDGQRADGQYPCVAPLKVADGDGGPAWADAGVICPWTIYKMYGDKRVLETHYDGMKRFIAFCKDRSTDELLPPRNYHCYGDWLNIDDDTPKDVIFTAYFGYSTKLLAEIAEVLGQTEDAATYNKLFERIREAFNKAYVQADGKIKGDSQTAYVLAIAHDLVTGKRYEQAAAHLVRKIEEKKMHLSTGFVGTKDLMLVLEKIGRNDIAYRLLHNDTFPSWGFSIRHGATSIWERWNGWTPQQGFGDPGMNSFAHYSFGAVCQWMFENIGGIRTDGAAFKRIVLKPAIDEKMSWASVGYDSIRGRIESSWKKMGSGLVQFDVTIPAGTTATVHLPAANADVLESGTPVKNAVGVNKVEFDGDAMVISLESGRYSFTTTLPEKM